MKEEAFAESTNRVRRSQWRKYRQFVEKWGLQYLPVSSINLCRYMFELASQGLAYVTINNYVSGVNLLSKLNGGEDLREGFGVGLMLRSLKRILGCVSKPKDPLLPEDLGGFFNL